jgi:hypothetical protein
MLGMTKGGMFLRDGAFPLGLEDGVAQRMMKKMRGEEKWL